MDSLNTLVTPVYLLSHSFNSIVWIHTPHSTARPLTIWLSIPLYGFLYQRSFQGRLLGDEGLSIPLYGFMARVDTGTEWKLWLSIPLYGFCTITLHVHCGNFSHIHCMDSIPLSPRVGAPCIWCRIWYLSFSLSFFIVFPLLWMGVSIVYC